MIECEYIFCWEGGTWTLVSIDVPSNLISDVDKENYGHQWDRENPSDKNLEYVCFLWPVP